MRLLRQEYRSRLPFPSPGDLPDPGIFLTRGVFLTRGIFLTRGVFLTRDLPDPGIKAASPVAPVLQADSFPAEPPGKPLGKDGMVIFKKEIGNAYLCFRTLVLTVVLFCFMDNGVFFIFSSQDVVAAEKKKQMVAEQVMIDHLSRQVLTEIHSESIRYISFLCMTSALEWSAQRFPYFLCLPHFFFPPGSLPNRNT